MCLFVCPRRPVGASSMTNGSPKFGVYEENDVTSIKPAILQLLSQSRKNRRIDISFAMKQNNTLTPPTYSQSLRINSKQLQPLIIDCLLWTCYMSTYFSVLWKVLYVIARKWRVSHESELFHTRRLCTQNSFFPSPTSFPLLPHRLTWKQQPVLLKYMRKLLVKYFRLVRENTSSFKCEVVLVVASVN